MNRRSILRISAMTVLGLAVLPGSAVSQQRSLKDQLVGSWSFASVVNTRTDGTKVEVFGPNPAGLLIFDGNGRYASLVVRPGVPKFASNNRDAGSAEENKAAMQGSIAHVGRYTINEADRSVTFHIEYSSFPNWNGTEQRRPITVAGDEMKYIVPTPSTGTGTAEVTFRRAGPATVGAGQGR
jgi:GH15 family glucan-1,4-alpha-glucosidase